MTVIAKPSEGGDTVSVLAELRTPNVPNFIAIVLPFGKEGIPGRLQEFPTIDVAEIDDDGLRLIGTAWTNALVANAQKRRTENGRAT